MGGRDVTYLRLMVIRRSLGGLRQCLWRAALAAAVLAPQTLPPVLWAQTPVSRPSSLSAEIEAKLKQRGTLILRDATLIETLFAIKENWEINIVVDNDVKGAINGAYTNAPLHEILDSILLPHGYGYRAVGDSLVVLKLTDIGAMKPLFTTEIIPLAHVPPEEVLKVIEFMLSPNGKAHAVPSSKSLVVMDFPDRIELIQQRIRDLDLAAAQAETAKAPAEQKGTSPVASGARTIVDMLLRNSGNSANGNSGTQPDNLPQTQRTRDGDPAARGPRASSDSGPAGGSPGNLPPAQNIRSALPPDRSSGSSAASESIDTGPLLDVAFFMPQYIRAAAIADTLSRMVSEFGQVSVIAEENRIVAIDQPEYLRRIAAAVERLDVPRAQVRIAAMIYDCSLEDVERLGINWTHSVKGRNLDAQGFAQDHFTINSVTITPPGPNAVNGAMTLSSLGRHFDVSNVIHALNSSSSSKLLADPTVVVLDQESAKIAIVTEIPYQQLTESAMGGTIGTTAFREAGVTLEVTPRVARDGTINLLVTPQFSVLTGFTENDNQPIIARREATTTVRVADNQTLVIGGLRQKGAVRDRTGIPYLSDLKLIGPLFRYRSDELRESELLVFITPAIIHPQTFGTLREQKAFENSACQLHGVRQCLECCNDHPDSRLFSNHELGYGPAMYEVPPLQGFPADAAPPPSVPQNNPPVEHAPEHVIQGVSPRPNEQSPPARPASSRREIVPADDVTHSLSRPIGEQVPMPPHLAAPYVARSLPQPPQIVVPTPTRVTDMPAAPHRLPDVRPSVMDVTGQADPARGAQAPVGPPASPAAPTTTYAPAAPPKAAPRKPQPVSRAAAAINRFARRAQISDPETPPPPMEGSSAAEEEDENHSLRSFFRL